MAGETVRFAGTPIELGGTRYVVPPLSLGQIRDLQQEIATLGAITAGSAVDLTQLGTVVTVVQAALSRNYPEITAEELWSLIDLGNVQAVMRAVATVSGLERGNGAPGQTAPQP